MSSDVIASVKYSTMQYLFVCIYAGVTKTHPTRYTTYDYLQNIFLLMNQWHLFIKIIIIKICSKTLCHLIRLAVLPNNCLPYILIETFSFLLLLTISHFVFLPCSQQQEAIPHPQLLHCCMSYYNCLQNKI